MLRSRPTVAGFFAGVGGIELGFELAGFKPVWSNEFDPHASKTFRLNHPEVTLLEGDIHNISAEDVPSTDAIIGGFPCQAFSVAGYRKGFQDPRGEVFFKFAEIIDVKRPQTILLENVKNLRTHDKGKTYKIIMETLSGFGYTLDSRVLNASEYGNVPQNRERIYIVGFQNKDHAEKFEWPEPIELTQTIHSIVDIHEKVDDKFYYGPSFPHFESLREAMDDPDTVYQWRRQYVRKNMSNQFPTLTANMGTGGHNVPLILTPHGVRKLTPAECFKVQGFPDFKLPYDVAQTQLYKQAGNSVVVPVVQRIATQMLNAML